MAIVVQTFTANLFALAAAATVITFPTPDDLWEVIVNPNWRTPASILVSEAERAQNVLSGQPLGSSPEALEVSATMTEVRNALDACVTYLDAAVWPDAVPCRETVEAVAGVIPVDPTPGLAPMLTETAIRAAVEVCRIEWMQTPIAGSFDLPSCLPEPVRVALSG